MQESWCLPWFDQWYASSNYTWVLCWLLWVAGGDVGDALAWAWSGAPGTCSAPPKVTCPAPPCAWLPSLPALHLLSACPTPCCFWSCLSNHVYCLWLLVLVWWCDFTPWCSAHEQGELCECWLWLLTVVCVICAGGVAVLVWLCWWCCWSTRVLGWPVSHTVTLLYFPLEFWCLDTSLHALGDWAAC
jgi:hypothetical protein